MTRQRMGGDVEFPCPGSLSRWGASLMVLEQCLQPNLISLVQDRLCLSYYYWKNCMPIHTSGAWEDDNGTIYLESSRVHDNTFPFSPSEDGRVPAEDTKADFVMWKIDPSQPTNTVIPDPLVVLDVPSEFPHIDECFMTHEYDYL